MKTLYKILSFLIMILMSSTISTEVVSYYEEEEINNDLKDDKNMTTYINNFVNVSGTNDDLEQLQSFYHIGHYNGCIYIFLPELDGDLVRLSVYKVDSITGTSVQVSTQSQFHSGGYTSPLTDWSFGVIDDYMVGLFFVQQGTSPYEWDYYKVESTDGGVTWTSSRILTAASALYSEQHYFSRFIDLSIDYFLDITSAAAVTFRNLSGTLIDTAPCYSSGNIYRGNIYDSKYWFVHKAGPTDSELTLSYFDGTDAVIGSFIGIAPLNGLVNSSVQLYWKFENLELLVDEERFYYREGGSSGTWQSISDTGTTTNGIIWDYDANGAYIPKYIIWKDSIYIITTKEGVPKKMQSFTDDAYVGWGTDLLDAWFTNGTDTIYQLQLESVYTIDSEFEQTNSEAPEGRIITNQSPSTIFYNSWYNDIHIKLMEGWLQNAKNEGKLYTADIYSLADIDLNRKIDLSYSSEVLTSQVIKDALDQCNYIDYNTDSIPDSSEYTQPIYKNELLYQILNDMANDSVQYWRIDPDLILYFDDCSDIAPFDHKWRIPGVINWGTWYEEDLTDWTDNNGTDCEVSIEKEVGNHYNVMELDDQGSPENCSLVYSISQTSGTIEIWMRTNDVTKATYIQLLDGGFTDQCYLKIDASKFQYRDATGISDVGLAAVNDTWYHIQINFDTTSTWDIEIDGVAYGPYTWQGTPTTIDQIALQTDSTDTGYQSYFDAIGFSWDGYKNGTNLGYLDPDYVPIISFINKDKQINVNKVIWKGGYDEDGNRLEATAVDTSNPSGITVQGSTPTIVDITTLQNHADRRLSAQKQDLTRIYFGVTFKGLLQQGMSAYQGFDKNPFNIPFGSKYILGSIYNANTNITELIMYNVIFFPTESTAKTSDSDGGINSRNNNQLIDMLYYDCKNSCGIGLKPSNIIVDADGNFGANPNVNNFNEVLTNWIQNSMATMEYVSEYQDNKYTIKFISDTASDNSYYDFDDIQVDGYFSTRIYLEQTNSQISLKLTDSSGNAEITITFQTDATVDFIGATSLTDTIYTTGWNHILINHVKNGTSTIWFNGNKLTTTITANNYDFQRVIIEHTSSSITTYLSTLYSEINYKNGMSSISDGSIVSEAIITDQIILNGEIIHNTVGFRATLDSNEAVPNTTYTIIPYNDVASDDGDNYDNSTYKFTAPVSGRYLIGGAVTFDAVSWTDGESCTLNIYKNGSRICTLARHEVESSESAIIQLSNMTTLKLAANDEIALYAYQNSGSSINTLDNVYYNYFTVDLQK